MARRYSTVVAAIDTAASALAQGRLVRDRDAVLHWEAVPTFQERFPEIQVKDAKNFLFYEDMSLKDISIACGFSYPSVFPRAFQDHFGQTPSDFRNSIRSQQNQSLRPEIRRLAMTHPTG